MHPSIQYNSAVNGHLVQALSDKINVCVYVDEDVCGM